MFKTGCIRVKGDSDQDKPAETACMFDSGALTTSNVDIRFLSKHPHLLAKIQPKKTKVILGDGNNAKAVMCDGVIYMDVEFADDAAGVHKIVNGRFIIMPTLNADVIIGLPHIVRSVPNLFIKMLIAAIKAATEQGEQQAMKSPDVQQLSSSTAAQHASTVADDISDVYVASLNINGLKHCV